MTVGPDGSYVGRIFEKNGSITTLEGKTQIKNGFIEDTCTKRNGTNVMVPCIERGRIIDMNACEIISTWEHSQFDTTTMRKVEK